MVPPAEGLTNEDPGIPTPTRVAPLSDKRPRMIGPYRIVYTIGQGVTGTVYLAEQTEPVHRRVTLKVIRTDVNAAELISRFRDEQKKLALERHPGIAEVYDAGVTNSGRPYFVTEHCPGLPITEYCELSRLSQRERLALFMQISTTVEHAHQLGIVHGDIKPANVIVSSRDGHPVVKITDFVVARLADPRLTELNLSRELARPVGKPAYMSPEQGRGAVGEFDSRTDIYSLGVLLHALLVGAPPLPSSSREKTGEDEILGRMRAKDAVMRGASGSRYHLGHATRPGVTRRRRPAFLPHERDLVLTTRKALNTEPVRRHATARELASEIQRYLKVDAAHRLRGSPVGALLHESLGAVATFAAALIIFAIGFALGGLTDNRPGQGAGVLTASIDGRPRPSELAGVIDDIKRIAPESTLPVVTHRREIQSEERRGWEERFLDLRRDLSLHTLQGHEDEVDCVAFSADSRLVASGSKDRTVRIWNVTTGRPVATLEGHPGGVLCVGFSPDGALVASGSTDDTVRIWDVATIHTGDVDVGEVPPGDEQHGRLVATLEGHEDDVDTLAFSPDGRHIASGSLDRTVRVWDVETRMLVGAQDFNRGPLRRVAFSPDGLRLVAAFSTGTVLILDPVTLYPTAAVDGPEGQVRGFAIGAGGTRAASSHIDGTIQLWSLTNGETFRTRVEEDPAWSVDLRPGGTRLVSAAGDGMLRIWDTESGDLESVLPGHEAAVRQVEYSPDGERIALASHDHTVRIWDAETTPPKVAFEGPRSGIRVLDVSHDGRLVAAGGTDGSAWLWDATTGDLLATLRGHAESLWAMAFSPSDRLLTTAAMDDVVLWSMETREQIAVLSGHGDAVLTLGYHPDGRLLATGTRTGVVRLWHVASRSAVATLAGHRGPVRCVTFRPDGRRLASASHDGTARVWDVTSEELVSTLRVDGGGVLCLAYGRDGNILATGSQDHNVRLWNVETGELHAVLRGHRDVIRTLEFSPDGARLLSASRDGTLRFWDEDTGEPIGLFESGSGDLACFSFSRDGTRIVVGTNRVEAWDTELASARALWRGAARRRLLE